MAEQTEIYYTDTLGDNAPLVLIHGYTCDHSDWNDQVSELANDFRVIAIDLAGHGQSETADASIELLSRHVAALIEHLDLRSAVLAGHSMGTRVVAEVARLDPVRVAGIVFVDGSRGASSEADLAQIKALRGKENYGDYARRLFGQMFTEKTDSKTRQHIIDRATSMDADWAMALHNDVAEFDAKKLPTTLQQVKAPILVIQTTTRSPEGHRASLSADQKTDYMSFVESCFDDGQASLAVIADIGHFPQFEAPSALSQLIREFAQSRQ